MRAIFPLLQDLGAVLFRGKSGSRTLKEGTPFQVTLEEIDRRDKEEWEGMQPYTDVEEAERHDGYGTSHTEKEFEEARLRKEAPKDRWNDEPLSRDPSPTHRPLEEPSAKEGENREGVGPDSTEEKRNPSKSGILLEGPLAWKGGPWVRAEVLAVPGGGTRAVDGSNLSNHNGPGINSLAQKAEAVGGRSPMLVNSSNPQELQNNILEQIQAQLRPGENESRISLPLPDLGEIRIQLHKDGNLQTAWIAAREGLVQQVLEENLSKVRAIFAAAGLSVDRIHLSPGDSHSQGADNAFQNFYQSTLTGSKGWENPGVTDSAPSELLNTKTMEEISERYRIRDLHAHIMDQIRVKLDTAKSEARIRLHPPELGEIKIHMVLEDGQLTVRMEISESLTRALLERNLQQLRETLSEAGIDVGRFDLTTGEKPSHHKRADISKTEGPFGDETEGEPSEEGFGWDSAQGPVRLSSREGGVDYMVY